MPLFITGPVGSAIRLNSDHIADSSVAGRALLTANSPAAQLAAIGAEAAGASAATLAMLVGSGTINLSGLLQFPTLSAAAIAQVVAWAVMSDQNGIAPALDLSGNGPGVLDGLLAALASQSWMNPGSLNLAGSQPTPAQHLDEIFVLSIGSPVDGDSVGWSFAGGGGAIQFKSSLPLAGSYTQPTVVTIGLQDHPTAAAIAAWFATNASDAQAALGMSGISALGNAVTFTDSSEDNYPYTLATEANLMLSESQAGVMAQPNYAAVTLYNAGWSITPYP